MTQAVFVSRGATESFHRLELPTQEEIGNYLDGRSMGGEVLSTHTTCWRQGRHTPDPSSALGCEGEVQDPSFISGKQAGLPCDPGAAGGNAACGNPRRKTTS